MDGVNPVIYEYVRIELIIQQIVFGFYLLLKVTMEFRRLFDILERYSKNCSNKEDVFAVKRNGQWIRYSFRDYYFYSTYLSLGLLASGVSKQDKIITIFSSNIPEWNFLDMGILQTGAVHVSIYPKMSYSDWIHIFNEINPAMIFLSDYTLYEKVHPLLNEINCICPVFLIEKSKKINNWDSIIDLGKKNENKIMVRLEEIRNAISPFEPASIIYTSGTTGLPKGVMLSHHNIISNVMAASELQPIRRDERVLSFLPLCHVFERSANYLYQYHFTGIYYAENTKSLFQNMLEVKPHGITTVPRLLEKILIEFNRKGKELKGIKKQLFSWSVKQGYRYNPGKNYALFSKLKIFLADRLVFKKWRQMLGGNLYFIGCGGASLNQRIEQIFWAAGMRIFQGYGLTEASPLITLNRMPLSDLMLGTVGPLIPGIELKFGNDNEILCKGPGIMMGYYKQEKFTREVLKNGWLHTGDTGELISEKFLKLTGRIKEMFKTSYGKYVIPEVIENKLRESVIIEYAMVVGEGKQFAAVLISPDFEYLFSWLEKKQVILQSKTDLITHPQVLLFFDKEIAKINNNFGQYDRICRYRLVPDEWSIETGELSGTLKLRRKFLQEKYAGIIEEIYGNE